MNICDLQQHFATIKHKNKMLTAASSKKIHMSSLTRNRYIKCTWLFCKIVLMYAFLISQLQLKCQVLVLWGCPESLCWFLRKPNSFQFWYTFIKFYRYYYFPQHFFIFHAALNFCPSKTSLIFWRKRNLYELLSREKSWSFLY